MIAYNLRLLTNSGWVRTTIHLLMHLQKDWFLDGPWSNEDIQVIVNRVTVNTVMRNEVTVELSCMCGAGIGKDVNIKHLFVTQYGWTPED